MRPEVRFLLAIVLMVGVLVGTNLLFPPVPPEEPEDTPAERVDTVVIHPEEMEPEEEPVELEPEPEPETEPEPEPDPPAIPDAETEITEVPEVREEEEPGRRILVEGPLYRYAFSDRGGRLLSAELLEFRSFTRDGPVELLPEETEGALGTRVVIREDTVDLRRLPFEVEPAEGLRLGPDRESGSLTFRYQHPDEAFTYEVEYLFQRDSYLVGVRGRAQGLGRGLLFTDLGDGVELNENRPDDDLRAMAFVGNHLQRGVHAEDLRGYEGEEIQDGPFRWAAFKSKYFVFALLAGFEEGTDAHLGGLIARELPGENRTAVAVTQGLRSDGSFGYRLFMGPQEFARLTALGNDLEEVNPYGWRFFRPIIRPFVSIVMTILVFFHENLNLGYGWVLILFGVLMRVMLFPLNQKAMRAQLRNMAVQPLLKEIQEKHKDNPEKLQQEMMKLYKEHGFNPVAGCLPMLLPWPILITLFFVFQNTIELRGVPFLWLPDLSSPDPFYILPAILGLSMFLLQFVSLRAMEEPNPQMKMMMWIMPGVMVFIFMNLASGLNLYYATANIATLPQQFWIANERKKAQAKGPITKKGEKKGGKKKAGKT